MRNKSVNQACHRKVIEGTKKSGKLLFITATIGLTVSSSLTLGPIIAVPHASAHASRSRQL